MGDSTPQTPADPREKVREFPTTAGVYLMKDARGRVIYVGKAVNLRSRAGSYFTAAAATDRRTCDLVPEIADIDFLETDSEVDALLLEARLIKDVQPRFNQELKDDKTFPYLENRHGGGLSASRVHAQAREARARNCMVHSPAPSSCGGRSPFCRRCSSFAPARWTSKRATRNGGGSGRACWPASTSAPRRATCGSARRSIAIRSAG